MDVVENMTVPQLKLYVKSVQRWKNIDRLNSMSGFRVANHAESDDYSRIIEDLKRDI